MIKPMSRMPFCKGKSWSRGFSLLELLVAMAVFLTISSVSFTLFSRHQALLSSEQLTVGLNIGLRNALSQIQLDVVNAGDGLILGTNVPAWPVGVTINNTNPTAAQCYTAATFNTAGAILTIPTYTGLCFDTLNVIVADPNTPAIHPCATTGCTISTSTGTTATGQVPAVINPATGVQFTTSQLASQFKIGDQVLFVQSCSGGGHTAGSSGCKFTTAVLSAQGGTDTTSPGCGTGCVTLTFSSTEAGGGNTSTSGNDPYGMTTNAPAVLLSDQYGPNDYIVRLLPITYYVNAGNVDSGNNPDPQLMRKQAGTSNVVMDQVIGFKVGAALWNDVNTSTFQYNYDASTYSTPYQFNLVRSVRVSIIGRTEPKATDPYRNAFDQGPYQIRGNSVIVDPRNLTMNND